jgi:endonuclease-3
VTGPPDPPPGPFDLERALARVEAAVRPYPKAALFELADQGYRSRFQIAVACIISTRTLDETTLAAATRLFSRTPTPAGIASLSPAEVESLIKGCAFAVTKAHEIRSLAERTASEFGNDLPCDETVLRSLPGIGPKCAALVLGIGCGQPRVAVDTHVHRIVRRWGFVSTRTPEETKLALEALVPVDRWLDLNRLLVPFGKHICRPVAPRCETCPLADMCARVGVTPTARNGLA